ncbi:MULTISPECIES: Rne/Rng family ribonuclease [unclassified Brevibacterium]|uniref:Rne/Rng family ribonuclease n=1 Tax=unclassified Brevibacterium TaxID=2614124 RepID=UPI001E4F6C26|nr:MULTISPECIES: Rne/Rng family ribonuclease [unclassified Brevibacterium]MDK8435683.1 Rne/Rng family ribonuclease [Brevibacterium sp. H-BE7]
MNDTSNDGNEANDATQGILADLADLQHKVNADGDAHEDVDDTVRQRLDHIAEAAESLRTGGSAEEADEAPEPEPQPKRGGPKKAREAVANRGLVFEQFVRDSSDDDSDDDSDSDDEDQQAQSANDREDRTRSTPSVTFDPRNPFAAPAAQPEPAAAPEPRATPPAPHDGGLIFQVPQAELAQVVHVEDDDDDDWDGSDDAEDTTSDSHDSDDDDRDDSEDDSNGRRRRRGGRGRRSRNRDDSTDSAESSEAKDSSQSTDETDDDDEGSRSSRRGGRSNRRSENKSKQGDSEQNQTKTGNDHSGGESQTEDSDDGDDDDDDGDSGSRRRRRSRSRTRSRSTDRDEVTSLKGSTRLEAKRQRRKEGREAGRRRPVITEAEFLARRESVDRTMIVRESGDQTQLVVVEDGIAVEHYLKENRQQSSLIGNVYLGKVQNVLPSMEAAFIDIGKGRNAVLYAGEVNWDALGMDGKARRIETALSSGDSVLVQVTKDPVGHKGARLTSQISLPGRFLVYVPGNSMTGISRKLPDNERSRLKKLLKELVGDSNGVIVRTAAEGATDKDLSRDVERLAKRWETIEKKSKSTKVLAPQLLYSEPDMIVRIIRDVFNEDFNSLVIDGDGAWDTIHEYVEAVAPDLLERVHRYSEEENIFDHYRIEEQIQKALQRTVSLPSGGSLVIDRTEAMTVVDVNTGKFTGSGGNLEETVTRNNLEAAEEVIRQVRLRDIGGIIVVDFIDMVLESNRDLVVRRLVECLGRDRTKHQVAEVTSLGLVQMTRKRIGTGLAESMVSAGADLSGRGLLLPGSEEDGSKSHRGGKSSNGSNNESRRDRKRRGESNGKSKNSEADSSADSVTSDASRSAVAAIAKATLKKDEDSDDAAEQHAEKAGQNADKGPQDPAGDAHDSDKDGRSGSGRSGSGRNRSRNGRRRSNADSEQSAESADNSSTGSQQDGTATSAKSARSDEQAESSAAGAAEKTRPATAPEKSEPAAELPLMIGADTATKVAKAEPVKRAPRRSAAAQTKPKDDAAKEQLPTSFVIIGES